MDYTSIQTRKTSKSYKKPSNFGKLALLRMRSLCQRG